MRGRILVLSLLLAGTTQAQVYQATQPVQTAKPASATQPAQSANTAQPAKAAPTVARPATAGPMLELDQKAINQQLTQRNKLLREEIASLREQNAKLQARLDEFTRLGGSTVRAYC